MSLGATRIDEGVMVLTRREFGLLMSGLVASAGSRVDARQSASWDSGKIAVPGGNVFWRAFGTGSKIPLLAVHGGPSGASSKPYEMLSGLGADRRLVTWDQLDCGESDRPNNPANWRFARFVEEMDAVRQALAPGPVHVMGGSWGSTLAMEWLVTKRPADVASVIFMCPTLDSRRAEASRRNAQMRLSAPSRAAFEEAARSGNFGNPALAAANAEYQRTYIMRRPRPEFAGGPPDPAMLRALSVDWLKWSRVADLATLKQPVLFIRGEHDYVTAEDVAVYAAARPGAQVETIPDAAHLAFVDNPDRTVSAIRRFFEGVER
jgi:L-proline amide hydrolase